MQTLNVCIWVLMQINISALNLDPCMNNTKDLLHEAYVICEDCCSYDRDAEEQNLLLRVRLV